MTEPKQFLLVDDDEIFLFTAGYALNRAFPGVEIVTSRNGEDALERLTDMKPVALFLDLNMPLMDGWEFLDKLVETNHKVSFPIIIVTSSIDPGDKKRAASHVLGPGFMEKPLTEEKIRSLEINPRG